MGTDDESPFEIIRDRHRIIKRAGALAVAAGLLLAAYLAYDWLVNAVSHQVLVLVAAVAILLGIQLLVLSTVSSMLISLYREERHYLDALEAE